MTCCSTTCRKWTSFGFSLGFLVSGFLLIFGWKSLFDTITNYELSLRSGTFQYKAWLDPPVDIYMDLFPFNWTNVDEFRKSKVWVKPRLEETGPYTFSIRLSRDNVKFNDNGTVSYNTIRTYHFVPERSNGSMDDILTVLDPVQMTIASVLKDKHYLIQRGTHYFLRRFNLTLDLSTTIRQLSFEGVRHPAMDFAERLRLMKGYDIPYDKFGWFYTRNGSASFEGDYTSWTGEGDIRKAGIIDEWNHSKHSSSYTGECSRVDGSSGDVFHPVNDDPTFSLFQADFCGKVTLERNGSDTVDDIEGNLYISTDKMFDNGTKYPERACFNPPGVTVENGLRNLTLCQYHAPAFISLPHFYLGDASLREAIDGMHPDPDKHKMYFLLEPTLGVPLKAHIVFQANMKLYSVSPIDSFKSVQNTTIPMMWIRVNSGMPDNYGSLIKLSFVAPTIGVCIGYSFVVLSLFLCGCGVMLEIKMRKGEHSYYNYVTNLFSKGSFSVTPLTAADVMSNDNNSV
ncbi:hypothetical protein WA026_005509 [Henosepilachna vigintioctopunctata]|uniref:Uncharacterized protein n=1 Tax=Henosepilachna vigintioctopunctata TaxID=420089 RepID=A0AAW1U205_9CUCU